MSSTSSNSESGTSLSSPNLPDEVWSKVFFHLSVVDRKNIRLCSRRFYQISNNVSLQKSEKMVLYGNFNTDAVIQFFSGAGNERKIWNIELNMVHLKDTSMLLFFKEQGVRVNSLLLNNCTVTPGLLRSIIVYCENLHTFALSFPDYFNNYVTRKQFEIIFDDFSLLRNAGIVCPNVINFTFNIQEWVEDDDFEEEGYRFILTNKKFLNFFAVFPNVKYLDFAFNVYESFNQFSSILSKMTSNTEFSFSSIYYQLYKMREQLESLKLSYDCRNFTGNPSFHTWNEVSHIKMKNLKVLYLNYASSGNMCNVSTFLDFKFLTNFTLYVRKFQTTSVSSIISLVLNTAKELYSLTIIANSKFDINKNCFQSLIRSKLRKLIISTTETISTDFESSLLENSISPNYILKYLSVDVNDNSIVLLFLTYFHCLEQLIVNMLKENILEIIFKYQIKLCNLKLYNYNNRGGKISLTSLQNWLENQVQLNRQLDFLTRLDLLEDESLNLSQFFLSKFTFPGLKSLVISTKSLNQRDNIHLFWSAIQKLIELEYLEIHWEIVISFPQWLTFCKTLSKLRYIVIFNKSPTLLDDLEYRQLFGICPSLRIIFHGNYSFSLYSVKYFKDIMTNTIRNLPQPLNFINPLQFVYEGIPYYKYKYEE